MLLNMFFIYLVALATEAAAFSSKRIGRMAADKNSLSNVGEVEKRHALHYTGQNGRDSQYIDAESGLKYQGKRRIRRRGPPLQKRRQKIPTKVEKIQSCPPEGCQLPLGNNGHGSPISIKADPLYAVEKEKIGATNLLPQVTHEEMANVARDNTQHAIKYRSLGNEQNHVQELKGEAAGNKLLDQSPQADGDDDYGQEQEEMIQNGIKSSVEETEENGEQILRPSDENLALVEKRRKRKYEENNLDMLAKVAGKQIEEGRLNNKKQLLVHENEAKFEEGKRRCCNKYPNYGKNNVYSLTSNEMTDAAEEDKEYEQDTQALMDEETVTNDIQYAEEDEEAMSEDNPSEVESSENKMEEGNVHKIQQRSESLEDKYSVKQEQRERAGCQQKSQKCASAYENKQALKGLSKTWRNSRGIARKGLHKKIIGSQEYLSQASAGLNKQAGHLSSNGDDRKSSLKGRSEGEEGGERDEEETFDSESVGDAQESSDRGSVLGNKNDQQQVFDQGNYNQNLQEQSAMNEQNEALDDEVQEEALGTKYESRQAVVDEQGAAESNVEESEDKENQAEELEIPQKRQVSEGDQEKEESRQAMADEQLESLSNYDKSASGGKITVKRAEHSERHAEETGRALADDDKESGAAESEISSLDTPEEQKSLEGDNMEDERDKRQLRNKASSNTDKLARLGQDSEVKIEQDHLQPQAEKRVQRQLSRNEDSNETPLEESQSAAKEASMEADAEQEVSLNESAEEQYESLNEDRETSNIAASETVDKLTRENREVRKQDLTKVKCCRNKNQQSLAIENYPKTADAALDAETDTQSSLENRNHDDLSAAGESAIMAPQETEGEASEEEYQELETNSEDAGEENLHPELHGKE